MRTFVNDVVARSPWSNQYEPPLEDGAMPSERLRKLEIEANAAFDQYRDMYVTQQSIQTGKWLKLKQCSCKNIMLNLKLTVVVFLNGLEL